VPICSSDRPLALKMQAGRVLAWAIQGAFVLAAAHAVQQAFDFQALEPGR
jgi:hypothetical protein